MVRQNSLALPDVSRETVERLEEFAALVTKWTARINLISTSSVADIWTRHILDSTQLYQYAPSGSTHWGDLGSGGGFPSIPLAIIAKERQPTARFTLIESDQRKATFLRTATRELGLTAMVITERIESAAPLNADVLTARALASLDQLLALAERHVSPKGIALFSKGRTVAEEVNQARQTWAFDLTTHQSLTDPEAQILQCERIARA